MRAARVAAKQSTRIDKKVDWRRRSAYLEVRRMTEPAATVAAPRACSGRRMRRELGFGAEPKREMIDSCVCACVSIITPVKPSCTWPASGR